MDAALVPLMLRGALADPILWIVGAAIGWDGRRPARSTVAMLGCAGAVWGCVRVAVYVSFGERLGLANAAALAAVCVAAMLAVGLAVRETRRYFMGLL